MLFQECTKLILYCTEGLKFHEPEWLKQNFFGVLEENDGTRHSHRTMCV
uniref:Uncharacterized protein n=1 Tax=Rhizophora mucronata TaxID=61149 RepID=A0A2P2QML7_RHIMU